MREMTLEITPDRETRQVHVWRSAPAFGSSHEPAPGAVWRGVLNNGEIRVKVGVYGSMLALDEIRMLARIALTAKQEIYPQFVKAKR